MSETTHKVDMSEGPPITATLAIEPPPEANCVVTSEGDNVEIQDHNLTFDRGEPSETLDNGTCNTNVIDEEEGVFTDRYVQSDIESDCFCLVFHEVDCVPSIERVQGNNLVASILLPDRETLRHLVSRLREVGAGVDVYGITQSNVDGNESFTMDITDVTDKQREAVMVAIETGYYNTPREADLDDLADRLDISKSAVSQRLKAIESKLVHKLVDHWSSR